MDDDVKNLFQKFGQPTEAYREINRELDSESAKKRWPLLRDVHLHGSPVPVQQHQHEEELSTELAEHQGSAFSPSAINSLTAKSTTGKAVPFAGNANAAIKADEKAILGGKPAIAKISGTTPLKQMLSQKAVQEEREPEPVAAPAFLAKIKPTIQQDSHVAENKLFSSLNKQAAAQESLKKPMESHKPIAHTVAKSVAAPVVGARQGTGAASPVKASAGNTSTFIHNIAASHTMPAKQQAGSVDEEHVPAMADKPAPKDKPVSAVFGRLAAKPEEEQAVVEAGVNSFFKKIFKS